VTKINFGGLGQPSSQSREAKFQLGPLYCSGADPGDHGYADRKYGPSPASCKDLWLRGQKQVGYYMVMERQDKFPKVVFCDLTKLPEEAGFQRTFGSPGNLRHFVAFDAALGKIDGGSKHTIKCG